MVYTESWSINIKHNIISKNGLISLFIIYFFSYGHRISSVVTCVPWSVNQYFRNRTLSVFNVLSEVCVRVRVSYVPYNLFS